MADDRGRLPASGDSICSAAAVGIGKRTIGSITGGNEECVGNAGDSRSKIAPKRSGFLGSIARFVRELGNNEHVEIRPILVASRSSSSSSPHSFSSALFPQNVNRMWQDAARAADAQCRGRVGTEALGSTSLSQPTAGKDLLDIEQEVRYFEARNAVQRSSDKQVHIRTAADIRTATEAAVASRRLPQAVPMEQVKDEKIGDLLRAAESRKEKCSWIGENAIAGGLAGVFVSLCLHPLDTVKTVLQSQKVGSRTIFSIVSSIVSERGVSGFYRGLGSNLTSSAPISAIYTFTYESVKAALLPHIPLDHHYLAHCAAGGCASVATSLVYTPSERVKQQMQIGAGYRNSGLALIGILQKGGPAALYAGWGAVLCRNVPHSVIKFFTYEGLKHRALSGCPPETRLSTLQTLVIGGIAGCTGALFTTPFDVVKTRLQTQAVGSPNQYSNVLHALQHIAANEGLSTLYRGVVPRLAIYVSQGALFFAAYEFFKKSLAIEYKATPTTIVKQPAAGTEG